MSIEKVEELILRQAREETDSLLEEAQQQAQRHVRQTEAQLRQRNQQELERYRRQVQEDSDRELAARTTEHNRELLVERNRLLGEVRQKAEARIAQRPQPQYRRWLAQQLRQLTDTKEGELLCRGDDHETIAGLLEELAGQEVRLNLTLSSEELQSAGGFVVRCLEYDVDVTLESQLRALWPGLLPEVANRLFGEPGNRGG